MQKAIFVPQKSVTTAFILALSRGLGEVGITLILGDNAVYDGRSDQALALSLVLVLLSFILFWLINLLEKK